MKCLLLGPKHNGIGRYMALLSRGLTEIGIDTDWMGFDTLCFELPQVLRTTETFAHTIDFSRYDVVHVEFGMYDMEQVLPLYLPPSGAPRFVLSAHSIRGCLMEKLGSAALQTSLDTLLCERFDHYVFFSSYAAKGFHCTCAERSSVLFYPSTHEFTHLDRSTEERILGRFGLPDSFLALPGYPSPWKDYSTLTQALSRLDDEVHFVFAGPRWSEKVAAGDVSAPGVAIRILDQELDEQQFLCIVRRSMFGILPYQNHATRQGNGVIANYLTEGKACVVTDALCLPEYLGSAGIVVPQHDPGALSSAIHTLLSRAQVRNALEHQAKLRAAELFSWRRHLEEHRRLYEEVLAR